MIIPIEEIEHLPLRQDLFDGLDLLFSQIVTSYFKHIFEDVSNQIFDPFAQGPLFRTTVPILEHSEHKLKIFQQNLSLTVSRGILDRFVNISVRKTFA